MLGGLDPVIIFYYTKKVNKELVGSFVGPPRPIPVAENFEMIEFPPIPIYLSETLFNIIIDGESKSVDIETTTETFVDGQAPNVDQKGLQSSVTVNIEGKADSVALTLLSAMIDQVFDKVSSKEYSITYLHGPITIFRGLLQSFAVDTAEGTDKIRMKFSLTKGQKNPVAKKGPDPVPGMDGTLPGG